MKSLKVLLMMAGFSAAVVASEKDYTEDRHIATMKYVKDAIEDFPGSIRRVQELTTVSRLLTDVVKGEVNGFNQIAAHDHDKAIKGCVDKFRYSTALLSYYANSDIKTTLIKKAQSDASECVARYDEYRKSFLAYNPGNTEFGSEVLDKLANKNFKP